jgi:hypothetical protein
MASRTKYGKFTLPINAYARYTGTMEGTLVFRPVPWMIIGHRLTALLSCHFFTLFVQIVGLNRKIQIKPKEFEEYRNDDGEMKLRCTEVQLVLKWGGNLTKLGRFIHNFLSVCSPVCSTEFNTHVVAPILNAICRGEAIHSFRTKASP